MTRAALASLLAVAVLVVSTLAFAFEQQSISPRPARTFPEYIGTWVLDEAASRNASGAEKQIVITTSPSAITLMKTPALYGAEVYRFDGTETNVRVGQGTLTLVAGALALTMKRTRQMGSNDMITVTTDAYSVSSDVLTIERQYSTIIRPRDGDKVGYIQSLDEENTTGARVKMVYRRQVAPAR